MPVKIQSFILLGGVLLLFVEVFSRVVSTRLAFGLAIAYTVQYSTVQYSTVVSASFFGD